MTEKSARQEESMVGSLRCVDATNGGTGHPGSGSGVGRIGQTNNPR